MSSRPNMCCLFWGCLPMFVIAEWIAVSCSSSNSSSIDHTCNPRIARILKDTLSQYCDINVYVQMVNKQITININILLHHPTKLLEKIFVIMEFQYYELRWSLCTIFRPTRNITVNTMRMGDIWVL